MKNLSILAILTLLACLAVGCGPSLREYVAQSSSYSSMISTHSSASVTVGQNTGIRGGHGVAGMFATAANIANATAGYAIEQEQGNRLRRIIRPETIADMMGAGFNENFLGKTHLQLVNQNENPSLRIFLNVSDYGIYADSMLDPMQFYVGGTIQIVSASDLKTIYQNNMTASRAVSDILAEIANLTADSVNMVSRQHAFYARITGLQTKLNAIGNVLSLVGSIANMKAFFDLKDDEVVTIFEYMAYDTGHYIANDLVQSIY